MDMLAVDPDFRQKIVHYAVAQGGVLYNPILHPGLKQGGKVSSSPQCRADRAQAERHDQRD